MSRNLHHSEDATQSDDVSDSAIASPASHDAQFETTPSLVPTFIWLVLTLLVGTLVLAYLWANPTLLGTAELTTILFRVIIIIILLLVVRYAIRLYILSRTSYVLAHGSLQRRYELLSKAKRRDIPLTKIRSHEVSQNRVQKLFGYGTISVNHGLGTIRLDDMPDPINRYEQIQRAREATITAQVGETDP